MQNIDSTAAWPKARQSTSSSPTVHLQRKESASVCSLEPVGEDRGGVGFGEGVVMMMMMMRRLLRSSIIK